MRTWHLVDIGIMNAAEKKRALEFIGIFRLFTDNLFQPCKKITKIITKIMDKLVIKHLQDNDDSELSDDEQQLGVHREVVGLVE